MIIFYLLFTITYIQTYYAFLIIIIGDIIDTLILNADATPLSQIPLSVVSWQDAIKMFFLGKIKIIKEYENWVIRSQKLEIKVPSVAIMNEHVKWNKAIQYSRNNIYLRDEFTCQLQATGRCRSLKGKVRFSELTLDHVVPKSQGGKSNWLNVCTSCKTCNGFKGDNADILPIKQPRRPTYYEILAKRKTLPLHIKDAEWAYYIDWPKDLLTISPHLDTDDCVI